MTENSALKKTIRVRMEETGEKYTEARRNVLAESRSEDARVETGPTERDALLVRQIKAMESDAFEQLVFELAHRENPEVKRLKAPDGGLDTVLLSESRPGKADRGWQAKHYPDDLHWDQCESSLESVAKRWEPSELIFVFPRDFSEQAAQAFQDRLVAPGQAKGIKVVPWTLSEVMRRLNEPGNEDLKVRFFGKSQESLMAAVSRTIQAGGQLESASDLMERATSLGEFTERTDPNFTYSTTSTSSAVPAPKWEELPYMTMQAGNEKTRVHVASWPREGAEVEHPTFFFTDDEEGSKAREAAVQAMARGEEAVLEAGVHLRLQAPELFKEAVSKTGEGGKGQLRIQPGEGIPVDIVIRSEAGDHSLSTEVRPVPFKAGAAAAFAGYVDLALVEITFTLLEKPGVRVHISIGGTYGSDASQNLALSQLLITFQAHTEIHIKSQNLFPGSGELSGNFGEGNFADGVVDQLQARVAFYEDLLRIEQHIGETVPIPDEFSRDDVLAAHVAAEVIKTGEGTGKLEQVEGVVENPLDIPRLPEEFRRQESVDRMVSYTIFGQKVDLGMGKYELPAMKIVEVVPQGSGPTAPARVVLEAATDSKAKFRLID